MRSSWKHRLPLTATVIVAAVLSGCVHRVPALKDDRVATILGRNTVGLSPVAARKTALLEAAKLTVDHGFRYFAIVSLANPAKAGNNRSTRASFASAENLAAGSNFTITLIRDNEIGRNKAGIWDAYQLLISGGERNSIAKK